jgi:3-deoxy-D-arabino-heptulosonate 7-phosphate (DAHP) synthase class II
MSETDIEDDDGAESRRALLGLRLPQPQHSHSSCHRNLSASVRVGRMLSSEELLDIVKILHPERSSGSLYTIDSMR